MDVPAVAGGHFETLAFVEGVGTRLTSLAARAAGCTSTTGLCAVLAEYDTIREGAVERLLQLGSSADEEAAEVQHALFRVVRSWGLEAWTLLDMREPVLVMSRFAQGLYLACLQQVGVVDAATYGHVVALLAVRVVFVLILVSPQEIQLGPSGRAN